MNLAAARRRRLWSIRELAQRAGVSPRTINTIELGRTTPSLSTVRKLSEALGIDPLEVDEFKDVILGKAMALASP
jgi:transcriptional regulator with XRE-family HTH domain